MKKEKQESPTKAAKKIVTKSIQQRLIKTIKTITAELGQVEVDIEKEAKKLAKKITKHLKTVKEPEKTAAPAVVANKVEQKSEGSNSKLAVKPAPVSTVKTPTAKPTTKSAPVSAAKKPIAKATPAKTPAPKTAAAKAPAASSSAAKTSKK